MKPRAPGAAAAPAKVLSTNPEAGGTSGFRFVFGPVPSRRLGRSLGIDTVPSKTCNWNCIYCQLGRTHPLTNGRRDFFPVPAILAEVRARLAGLAADAIDWVTFVASGEGTLHRGISGLIREVKLLCDHPVAVITNGSQLHLEEVREALAQADAVLPTLDAGDAALFRQINRPHRRLSFEQHVAGIEAFARMSRRGRLWIEVMLIEGLNDTEDALHRLAAVLARIRPDEIHLTLPSRCPVEPRVRPSDAAGIARAQAILGARATIAVPWPQKGAADPPTGCESLEEPDLLSIVGRHPLRRNEVARLFPGWTRAQGEARIDGLRTAGQIRFVQRDGEVFIVRANSRFPTDGEASSGCACS